MAPGDFERVVAGALWRAEREEDQIARIIQAIASLTGSQVSLESLNGGRKPGTSRVPGYRREE